jgi:hypothetical protein
MDGSTYQAPHLRLAAHSSIKCGSGFVKHKVTDE